MEVAEIVLCSIIRAVEGLLGWRRKIKRHLKSINSKAGATFVLKYETG